MSAGPLRPVLYQESGDWVRILDQRRLPAVEEWLSLGGSAEVAEAIRTLAVRGAPAIGVAAAYGLAADARRGLDPAALRRNAEVLAGPAPPR